MAMGSRTMNLLRAGFVLLLAGALLGGVLDGVLRGSLLGDLLLDRDLLLLRLVPAGSPGPATATPAAALAQRRRCSRA